MHNVFSWMQKCWLLFFSLEAINEAMHNELRDYITLGHKYISGENTHNDESYVLVKIQFEAHKHTIVCLYVNSSVHSEK